MLWLFSQKKVKIVNCNTLNLSVMTWNNLISLINTPKLFQVSVKVTEAQHKIPIR